MNYFLFAGPGRQRAAQVRRVRDDALGVQHCRLRRRRHHSHPRHALILLPGMMIMFGM